MIHHQDIEELIRGILPEIVDIRHRIHQNPELAHKEYATAGLVRESLSPLRLRLLEPFLQTDVTALMEGNGEGVNVTLRADMDALPVPEKTEVPYRSSVSGVSHACGHDGHMAMLIGAARVLNELQTFFRGSVRFVFQPGEEVVAGGRDLVAGGCLDDPLPAAILALHGWPGIPAGILSSRPGEFMAAADFFEISVRGVGAHGSLPEQSVDPILTGSRIVEALQSVATHCVSALDPVVISVCCFKSGYGQNVIPDTAVLEGTVRYLDADVGKEIPEHMETIVRGICDSMQASYDFVYDRRYLPTRNDEKLVGKGRTLVTQSFGPSGWKEMQKPSMGSEDFSFYLRKAPGAMFRLGMGRNCPSLHSPYFDFNDEAISRGIYFLVAMTLEILASEKNEAI